MDWPDSPAQLSSTKRRAAATRIAQQGNFVVRVSFRDYSFFVPTDINGKKVMLVGEVVGQDLTPEKAQHLAEDLGQSKSPVAPGREYTIVASSVRIPVAAPK